MRIWLYNIQEILKGKGFLVSPNLGTLGQPVFYYKTPENAILQFFDGNKRGRGHICIYIYIHMLWSHYLV